MDKLDTTLQDARTLLKSAQNHAAGENGPGIAAGLTAGLAGAIESAAAADITQRNAIRDVGRLTDAQDKAMKNALDQLRKVRFAGKACYKKDEKQILKEFRVGAEPAQSVKGMLADLAYLRGVAQKRINDLAASGFRAADLAALDAAYSDLESADVSQELAKKTQKNATQARNDGYAALREAMQKVRNAAKSVFIGKSDVLREFETIVRAKSVRGRAKASSADAGS